jgi:hypothetical protein
MEQLHRMDWADVPVTAGWVQDPQDATLETQVQNEAGAPTVEQTYAREFRVTADPAGQPQIRQIDVRVTWYEPNDPPAPAEPRRRYAITSLRYDED